MAGRDRVEQLKRVLRWRENSDRQLESVAPGVEVDPEQILDSTPEKIAELLGLPDYGEAAESDTPEEAIDHRYYSKLMEASRDYPSASNLVDQLVRERDIVKALRMLKSGKNREEIGARLIDDSRVPDAETYEELLSEVAGEFGCEPEITDVERALRKQNLAQGIALLHSQPLSAEPVVGYIVALRNEVRNLKALSHGLEAGRSPEKVMSDVVSP